MKVDVVLGDRHVVFGFTGNSHALEMVLCQCAKSVSHSSSKYSRRANISTIRRTSTIKPEREIASLYKVVQEHENEWIERGHKARQAYETWFATQVYWRAWIQSIQVIQKHQRVPETIYARSLPLLTLVERGRQARIRTMIRIKGMIRRILKLRN